MDTEQHIYKIYMYENKINNKKYIGQTCQTLYQRSGKNGYKYRQCPIFWLDIQKYGWENFKCILLENNLTKEEADKKEQYYIKLYNTQNYDYGYNILKGGQSDISGENNPFYGKHHTEETKQKMREHHADVSGENNPMYGKHHTEETKNIISQKMKNFYSTNNCASYNRFKPIKNITLNIVYYNSQEAAESLNKERRIGGDHIQRACRKQLKTAYGYEWTYITQEEYENGNKYKTVK